VSPRPIALLTDYGERDPFVGICRAVIARVDPAIPLIDLTHGIPRQDVLAGALALADAAAYLPQQCVVLGVVDPGVGSNRRAVAIESGKGLIYVGPDNGLLMPAVDACGGATAAYEISNSPWRLEPTSKTFHGRDIFAPVAAQIAVGAAPAEAGEPLDTTDLVQMEIPRAERNGDQLTATVLSIDVYGNVRLNARAADLGGTTPGEAVEILLGGTPRQASFATTYAEGGHDALLLLEDSSGALSLAINGGDAAAALGLARGDHVRLVGR
jgi:S-adenosylmethionine hydrolase